MQNSPEPVPLPPHSRQSPSAPDARTRLCFSRSPRRQAGLQAAAARRGRRRLFFWSWKDGIGRTRRAPELSESKLFATFTRLSTWNYAHRPRNVSARVLHHEVQPRVNELVARIEGLAEAHPYRPESLRRESSKSSTSSSAACSTSPECAITLQPLPAPRRVHRNSASRGACTSRRAIRAKRFSSPTPRTAPIRRRRRSWATWSRISSRTPTAASTSKHSRGKSTERPLR